MMYLYVYLYLCTCICIFMYLYLHVSVYMYLDAAILRAECKGPVHATLMRMSADAANSMTIFSV